MPFGGFPWGRLAFAETASPFTPYAALGGAPLVTFAIALCGALAAAAVLALAVVAPGRRRWSLLAVAVPVAGLLLPVGAGEGRPVTVAVVQGNVPRLGLDLQRERERCCATTSTPPTGSRPTSGPAGSTEPDLVIWPENSSDIDPFRDPSATALIDDAVQRRSACRSWSAPCSTARAPTT